MPGVEKHAVALAGLDEALLLHHCLHIRCRHDAGTLGILGDRQPLHTAVCGCIEKHAAADEALFGDALNAQIAHADHAAAAAPLVGLLTPAAVVHEVALRRADADVAGA